jgi:gliding motility-associated-like protein
MLKYFLFILLLSATYFQVQAQTCSTLGQTPATAFPVCGTDTFSQSKVPLCGGKTIPLPACPTTQATDINPFWYRFTCFSGGTLGLTITPIDLNDDYDWEVFDITGHDPSEVYTNASLNVGCNWSGLKGVTGTSLTASSLVECGSYNNNNPPIFSALPTLIQGHEYLLLVSNFSSSQKGYKLSFGGGTASITDTTRPAIKGAKAVCDGEHMTVFLSKKMKCSSLASDGSDFVITPPVANVISAVGNNCATGFDLDTVYLTLDKPLAPGNYSIKAAIGSDGNTLLDNCANSIVKGDSASITIYPVIPTQMDSIDYAKCGPQKIFLYFKKPIYCKTIAPDGSDFVLSGPSAIQINKAIPITCSLNLQLGATFATGIELDLSASVFTGGTYTLKLVNGTDGNTLIDECDLPIALNSTIDLNVYQSVSAKFSLISHLGCKMDTINFSHDGANGVTQWYWTFDSSLQSTTQTNKLYYKAFGTKSVKLVVTNGFCSDSASITYTLSTPNLKAAISSANELCPNDTIVFKDASTGSAIAWHWDFSNGQYSNLQNPPAQHYPSFTTEREYPIKLEVTDSSGCIDVTYKLIKLIPNCYIAVASAFTPNGDGLNDYLYPLNAYKAINLTFKVYNRYGQLIFQTNDWTRKWDGKLNGADQPSGTYVWMLDYTDISTNKPVFLKGTTVLIR